MNENNYDKINAEVNSLMIIVCCVNTAVDEFIKVNHF